MSVAPAPGDDDAPESSGGANERLRRRTAGATAIRLGAQGVQFALTIGSGAALARLLTPRDFGLFAMSTSLIAFVGSFRDFGLPMATAHQTTIDQRQLSALFWLTVRLNLLLLLFMAAMAPLLARFYGELRLVPLTLLMAVGVFVIGLSTQHESLLTRQMRFGALTLIETGALLAGIGVGIGAALLGIGPWALVCQFLMNLLAKSAALWLVCAWRPDARARSLAAGPDLRAILTYSRHTTGFRVLAHIGRNLDRVLVGYFGGSAVLGLYDKSYQWSIVPTAQVQGPLLGVAVASLSRVRHDAAAYRAGCRAALLPVFSLSLPASAFMVVEARAIILLLLGPQWLAAVPLFRLFSIAAFVGSISTATKWLYLSQGDTRRQLRWSLIATPIMILAVASGVAWGALGVAIGFTIATCLLAYPSVWFCLRTSPLGLGDFLGIVWRPVLAALGAALALFAARALLPFPDQFVVALGTKLLLFGGTYLLCWLLLPGGMGLAAAALRDGARPWLRAGARAEVGR